MQDAISTIKHASPTECDNTSQTEFVEHLLEDNEKETGAGGLGKKIRISNTTNTTVSPYISPLGIIWPQLTCSLKTGSKHQMQTERTAKGTLVIWPEEGKEVLLSVIESEESPWLFFFSLPPWPSADPVAVAVNVELLFFLPVLPLLGSYSDILRGGAQMLRETKSPVFRPEGHKGAKCFRSQKHKSLREKSFSAYF